MDRPERRTPPRALTGLLVAGLLVGLAVVGLVRSAGADGPATPHERAHEVAASLRCPTCQGLSVADSNSPLAKSMRRIIDEQVAAGRTQDEVREYFVDRYGDWVLLAPRASGGGWLVWLLPAGVILVGLLAASRLIGRRRSSQALRWVAVGGTLATALGVLLAANLDERGAGELGTGNLPAAAAAGGEQPGPASAPAPETSAGSEEGRLLELQQAVDRRPEDVRMRLALASTALETGRLDVARDQADAVLAAHPRNVDALMMRGLAASSAKDAEATAALRRFLEVAPADHPALPLVRGLLGDRR